MHKLSVEHFRLSNSSLLNRQLSGRKVEHRLYRSCAKLVQNGRNCAEQVKIAQQLHSARLQFSGETNCKTVLSTRHCFSSESSDTFL